MDDLSPIQRVAAWILPVIFAITVHESAHGWMAKKFGDRTAEQQGRLSLNPIKHIDLFGTIIVPGFLLLTFSGFIFGWAKPVPIDPRNFKQPRKAMMYVALAGPLSNLLMALGWALLARLGVLLYQFEFISDPLIQSGKAGITINLVIALINLLPIPPLDGSRVISGLLPNYWAWQYNRLERFGFLILLLLLSSQILGVILDYPLYISMKMFFDIAGL
jgi:Zn-dependent protease